MFKLDKGNGAPGAPTHETTGLFFPQFVPIPGPLAGQMQLMLVPGSGIPMRDFFAVKVLSGQIAATFENSRELAGYAYRVADAMIEARKHKTNANGQKVSNADGFPYTDGDL